MTTRRTFVKDGALLALGMGLLPSFLNDTAGAAANRESPFVLPRSTPESQGISSAGISRFLEAIKQSKQEFHSLMILRHGNVIAEGWWAPYSAEHRQQLYSLSKSFTGTAIGFAAGEGLITVDDPVIKFFPDYLPAEVGDNLKALKIRHLLSMSVGQAKDAILFLEASPAGVPWEKTFLNLPVAYPPGSRFLYNSGASFMLSAIVKKVTGQSEHEYLKPRLYEPLNITKATWGANWEGINMGASHLRIPTEDIAKFGQTYLQNGVWNGKQVVSREWVMEASSKQMENGHNDSSWGYGYGFQFWLNPPGGYRADGAFGQYSMILPELDAVVAITSESIDTKTTMQIVWDVLLPEMKPSLLPPNASAHHNLLTELKSLRYDPPQLATTSPLAPKIDGKEFILEINPYNAKAVSFRFEHGNCFFTLKEDGKPDINITSGPNQWIRKGNYKPSAHSLFSLRRIDFDSIVAAAYGWQDDNTLVLTWRYIETVHGETFTCIFEGDKLTIKPLFSINRLQGKPDDRADITGIIV